MFETFSLYHMLHKTSLLERPCLFGQKRYVYTVVLHTIQTLEWEQRLTKDEFQKKSKPVTTHPPVSRLISESLVPGMEGKR